ncbi:hypothetical protein C2E20_2994 [Micractinium conductrix]|uniref:Uncharacterized protein n=1 Tax=Micractinium conductrix TaxID=554055 RepID=A0A2P6VHM2_9CHLO|nr:hypothetical protein C2E20_2994 [Micractinium conductrix]|eukprot:PSC73585.1 hypothetical protein C2E20_2994 [Micractinium conductrix]
MLTLAAQPTLKPVAACRQRSAALISCPTALSHGGRSSAAPAGGRQQQRRRRAAAAALDEEQLPGGTTDETLQPSTSYSASSEDDGSNDSRDFAVAMAKVAWETKAEDILVLHVEPVVYWTRFMLIATVFSRPQLNAILGKMTKEAEEAHGRRLSVNPTATSGGWELLDYGDVVVHILTHEQREYYDLESFYGAAEEVALPFEQEASSTTDVETWTKKL